MYSIYKFAELLDYSVYSLQLEENKNYYKENPISFSQEDGLMIGAAIVDPNDNDFVEDPDYATLMFVNLRRQGGEL